MLKNFCIVLYYARLQKMITVSKKHIPWAQIIFNLVESLLRFIPPQGGQKEIMLLIILKLSIKRLHNYKNYQHTH
jgi:hypothetical protein